MIIRFFDNFLSRFGIRVAGISADGDTRLLSSMKRSLNAMFNQSSSDVISNLCREQYTSFIQDTVHLATKLRNRLLKPSTILPMGSKQVSVSHLKILINTTKKEIHGLVKSDIVPEDRQNYNSFVKITSNCVLDALKLYVNDSEGTITYLKISRGITEAYTQMNLSPLNRVYKIWYGLYFFRSWKKWISNHENGQPEKFRVYENFITESAFTCLELNAYGILHLIMKFRTSKQPHLFLITLFNSQHCEHTFRQLRSMTTANWTKINFALLELLHMMGRIELQNEIAHFKLQNLIKMPRIHNQCEKHELFELPSDEQLQTVLKKALDDALKTAAELNMTVDPDEIRSCELKKRSSNVKQNVQEKSVPENTNVLSEISIKKLNCSNIPTCTNDTSKIDGNSRFIRVMDEDGTVKVIRKSKILWLVSQPAGNLSKDRLKRVQGVQNTTTKKRKNTQNDYTSKRIKVQGVFEVINEIQIGQWCIFEKSNEGSTNQKDNIKDSMRAENEHYKKFVVGVILGFKYIIGKNQTEKQYSLDTAPVLYDSINERGVEVNALWYTIKHDLKLELSANPSFFIDIKHYVAHAPNVKRIENSENYVFDGNVDRMKLDLNSNKKKSPSVLTANTL